MTTHQTHSSISAPSGIELDTDVRPQDDFFSFVNQKWIASHPIPGSESRWGTFNVLREKSWNDMRALFEELQTIDTISGTVQQLAKDFYYTGMHYADFEDQHVATLRELIVNVDTVNSPTELCRLIGDMHAMDIDCFWQTYVDSDHDDSTKHIFNVIQSGLTLPNRDYYLDDSAKMSTIRDSYKQYSQQVHAKFPELAVNSNALWNNLISVETALATISRASEDLRDVEKNYNKTTYAALVSDYEGISWDVYATALGWKTDDKISVHQPEFLQHVQQLFKQHDQFDAIKTYLKWKIVVQCISKVGPDYSQIHFDFFGKVLSGTKEIMPLWKRVVRAAEQTFGDGTGQLYSDRHFPESSKQQVQSIVADVQAAFDQRIDQLDWMSDTTKTYAKKKLANMKVLIGFPDTWRDFSELNISRDNHLANVIAAQRHEVAYYLNRLHQPISRDDWYMTPQTVNAYHDPNRLVICFPAGILQAPFYDPSAELAVNMGGIGTVIGHELTHGFDDQGCQFDAEGNVRMWQSETERADFAKKAQIIVDQADEFEVLPGLNLKGKLVLGESIADLGGLELSLHALKSRVSTQEYQRAREAFFVSYAYTECGHVREEKAREDALTDPHPASEFRVNGIIQHVDAFYDSFGVNDGDNLYTAPDKRAKIW